MYNIYNDKTYLNNNPTWHEEDAPLKTGKIIELLNRNNIHFNTVCDIGCGSGEILIQLANRLNNTVNMSGFDISKDAIAIARRKETNRIKFEQRDVAETVENYHFDLLLVIDVIEHIENYFRFLDKVASLGKYTIFHIPLDMCLWSLFQEKMLIESKERVGHIHNFTEAFIESILMDKGFKIIDKLYTEPSFTNQTFKQKLINQFRKVLFKINKKLCTKTLGGYSILLLTENPHW
ncbi:class I SAM-dependent methyltransferase [Chitinophagaceae bacterium LB-8]|uniref:Class I SAM-dependent methyltransferase n=1 Tax=Paraflavisolibacter caeni TaxID=2982496 RepID=A0A9X3BHW1_9BACT|nr:class I SAM-dependent methyltransferase [Paraflavisolibacter caeni]MCU7550282.1 class I SAM-dependent methyltransferase [Paraflavisolibacter caeni]